MGTNLLEEYRRRARQLTRQQFLKSVTGHYLFGEVTDDGGATANATTTANINTGNEPPIADPMGPYSGTVGVPVSFEGSGSSDPDGSIAAYSWDFGDGSTSSATSPSHTYDTIGTSTMQSRTLAGVANATYVFCLPGSSGACKDAWTKLISHQLDYRTRPCNLVELMPRLLER